eukprot:scaffold8113_cov85-Skeletonema_dohrnii-CCMP3373.AAC.1
MGVSPRAVPFFVVMTSLPFAFWFVEPYFQGSQKILYAKIRRMRPTGRQSGDLFPNPARTEFIA